MNYDRHMNNQNLWFMKGVYVSRTTGYEVKNDDSNLVKCDTYNKSLGTSSISIFGKINPNNKYEVKR